MHIGRCLPATFDDLDNFSGVALGSGHGGALKPWSPGVGPRQVIDIVEKMS